MVQLLTVSWCPALGPHHGSVEEVPNACYFLLQSEDWSRRKQRLQLVIATPLEPNRHLSSVFPSKLPAAVQSRARGQALITGLHKHLSDGAVGRRLEQLSGF